LISIIITFSYLSLNPSHIVITSITSLYPLLISLLIYSEIIYIISLIMTTIFASLYLPCFIASISNIEQGVI